VGPVELFVGESVARLPALERTLLAALTARVGERVAADVLEDALWPTRRPATARKTLQGYIMRLRRVLGPASITQLSGGYRLDPDRVDVDGRRVTRLVWEAREAIARGDHRDAVRLLREAGGLFRGDPYEDVPDTALPAGEVQRLDELRAAVFEESVEAELGCGGGTHVIGELEAFLQRNPYRERAWGQLMLALYRAGRPADALAAYGRARVVLAAELGIEPGPGLRDVEQAILTHDPRLRVPVTVSSDSDPSSVAGWVADVGVLGAVMVGGAPVSSRKRRRLLSVLTIAHGRVVSSDRLSDIVWEGEPPDSKGALRVEVSRLRATLGVGSIVWRSPGYALVLPAEAVDAWRFESLVEMARQRPPGEALVLLDEALGLWRGAAYAEFADEEFAQAEAVRLEELRASTTVARIDTLLELGRADEAAAETVRLIEADPYRESVWERRMRALHAAGRTVDAVRVFRQYRRRLADETGLEPSAELAALEQALVSSPTPSGDSDALPLPLTSLVGREAACDELVELVAAQRVVTLVGPGGVGKTRLAVEVARACRERRGFPVAYIELVAAAADGVATAVTRSLALAGGSDPMVTLRSALVDRDLLLVVDNCEHVVDAAAEVVSMLVPFCPRLRVLATSRIRLGVAGERVWMVAPLPVPDPEDVEALTDLDRYAATHLFLERAATDRDQIARRVGSARAVARICAAVDGLPLGIELTAARTGELPLDRIADGFAAHVGHGGANRVAGRHRSIDAAIGWSYELLSPVAQRLVRSLAVFDGGWTIEAAEALCAGDDLDSAAVSALLADSVAASLVMFEPATGRYAMLETVRSFGRARLAAAGETETLRDSHLRWCRQLAAIAAPGLVGSGRGEQVRRLDYEHPNLLAALRWALTDNRHPDAAAALAHDLLAYWYLVDEGHDVAALLDQILDRPGPPSIERVELTLGAGHCRYWIGEFDAAAGLMRQALELSRTLESPRLLAHCMLRTAGMSDTEAATALIAEAETITDRLGDPDLAAHAARLRGMIATRAGRYDDAIAHFHQALAAAPDPNDRLNPRFSLAAIHGAQGCWQAARDQLLAAEQEAAATGSRRLAAVACVALAQIELAANDLERARQAFDRSAVWDRPTDAYPAQRMERDAVGALLRAETGDLATARAVADKLAALPADIGDHGAVCDAWLITGEILARNADMVRARGCFGHLLRHRRGSHPDMRANGLEAMAGTLDTPDQRADADRLAAAGATIRARHDLVTPPWLTVAITAQQRTSSISTAQPPLADDEAVALALTYDRVGRA
jgi:DNA-binding SARP family transcriptional activator/predicted ATPase